MTDLITRLQADRERLTSALSLATSWIEAEKDGRKVPTAGRRLNLLRKAQSRLDPSGGEAA